MPTSSRRADGPVLITLGSNIEPQRNLPAALELLAEQVEIARVSRVYEAEAVDAPGTPRFLNAAAAITTGWPPARIKYELLRPVEIRLGRVRSADRNAPRTIDLDLALVGSLVLDDPAGGVRVPDPDILRRAHVALPLAEVAPEARHPLTGETLATIAGRFAGRPGIRVFEALTLRP